MKPLWRKRGRPRLDRPDHDSGTPELQAYRMALSGGGDPALSEHPLGVMLARRLITAEQHEAGCHYAMLYGRAVARTSLSTAPLYRLLAEGGQGREPTEEELSRARSLYRLGKNRLLAAGTRVSAATENIAVFGRPARFLIGRANGTARRAADAAELAAVLQGLSVLVACYGRGARRRGRTEEHKSPSMLGPYPRLARSASAQHIAHGEGEQR